MQASFQSASTLRQIVDSAMWTVSEVFLQMNEGGMGFRSMDSAHVALVEMDLPATVFTSYSCPRPVVMSLSLQFLGKILKSTSPSDSLCLRCATDPDVLYVLIKGPEREAEYELKLMNIEDEQLGIPELKHEIEFEMDAKIFQSIITNLTNTTGGDNLEFCVMDGRVCLVASGDMLTGHETLPVSVSGSVRLAYQLKYVVQFVKASGLSPTVNIGLATDQPMVMRWGVLTFYLAPKLDME